MKLNLDTKVQNHIEHRSNYPKLLEKIIRNKIQSLSLHMTLKEIKDWIKQSRDSDALDELFESLLLSEKTKLNRG